MTPFLTRRRWTITLSALLLLVAASALVALHLGPAPVGLGDLFNEEAAAQAILFASRLPRLLLALLVGAALASAGGAYQALLRNPLADPFILGVSGGAALGSVIGVGLRLPFALVTVAAFVGALATMLGIFWVARTRGRLEPTTLLLTGVIFNAFCFALILFVNAVVPMEQAYEILILLIGNLGAIDLGTVAIVALFVVAGLALLIALAWRMNLLTLGDDEAAALGVDLPRVRLATFAAASLMVGAAVAVSGLIGFVGLFIPHIVRLLFGPDHRLLIPASALMGAAFLALADTAARTLLMDTAYATQLPVGVITALVGAPLFIVLLRRHQRGRST